MNAELLALETVTLRRGGRMLFESLSLSVKSGDGVHVSGPNGAGKSSLLRLAAGLLRPDVGALRRPVVALADEAPALDRGLPLRRALSFWADFSGTGNKLDQALDELNLRQLADVPVGLLSSGQIKRATLARVACSGADLWLLDEPLNGLDRAGVEGLTALVGRHRSIGGAVVAASHASLAGEWSRLELGR